MGSTVQGMASASPGAAAVLPVSADTPATAASSKTIAPFPVLAPSAASGSPLLTSSPSNAPFCNSQPVSSTAATRLIKLGISAIILLLISYFTIKTVYPVLRELAKPGSASGAGKDAPSAVQMIQQTREVVAKNNANVAHLDSILNDLPETPKIPLPELPAAPAKFAPKPAAAEPPPINTLLVKRGVDALHVHGVVGGNSPKIMVGGMLLGIGQVVDAKLGLKFVALDEDNHVIILANEHKQTFTKSY